MAWVSIAAAARRLGVSQDTVRRRIHKGELKAQQESTPQGFVWQVELPEAAQEEEGERESPGEAQALQALVAALQAQVASQQEELEARRREVQELHVLLQQSQHALPPPRQEESWWRRLWPWGGGR